MTNPLPFNPFLVSGIVGLILYTLLPTVLIPSLTTALSWLSKGIFLYLILVTTSLTIYVIFGPEHREPIHHSLAISFREKILDDVGTLGYLAFVAVVFGLATATEIWFLYLLFCVTSNALVVGFLNNYKLLLDKMRKMYVNKSTGK